MVAAASVTRICGNVDTDIAVEYAYTFAPLGDDAGARQISSGRPFDGIYIACVGEVDMQGAARGGAAERLPVQDYVDIGVGFGGYDGKDAAVSVCGERLHHVFGTQMIGGNHIGDVHAGLVFMSDHEERDGVGGSDVEPVVRNLFADVGVTLSPGDRDALGGIGGHGNGLTPIGVWVRYRHRAGVFSSYDDAPNVAVRNVCHFQKGAPKILATGGGVLGRGSG